MIKQLTLIASIIFCLCSIQLIQATPILAKTANIQNFGEPNLKKLRIKIKKVKTKAPPPDSVLRITQLGDSHTAADIFTGKLRELLQTQLGDAGIGWVSPLAVYGQRSALISYNSKGWELVSSRTTAAPDYPLGGFIGVPTTDNAKITLNYKHGPTTNLWNATFLIKQEKDYHPLRLVDHTNYEARLYPRANHQWHVVRTYATLPFTLTADNHSVKLGGIWLEKNGVPGVILSAIGINGAKQNIWSHWRTNWLADLANTRTDLIILSYGTNEAVERDIDINEYKQSLLSDIKKIRQNLPNAAILIISAPDAITRGKTGSCQQRQLASLAAIKMAQRSVARQAHTLFWDWQKAMGGPCSMIKWSKAGLANKDLVHLTTPGYEQSANSLYNALMKLLNPN